MNGNSVIMSRHSGVLSVASVDAPEVITSAWIDEQLAETYERTGIRPGLLEGLAGIVERRWWPTEVGFADAAAMAGQLALDRAGITADQVGLLVSTSVCKDHLEPSMACAVHDRLDLPTSCLNFDVGNACLGFVNGMQIAAQMLDAGAIDYALIVDGEGSRRPQESTIERLQSPDATAEDVVAQFATLTLGSGAAAMVVARTDAHPGAHRIVGGIARAATQHHRLCVGDLDRMTTDTHGLLVAGLEISEAAWKASGAVFDWEEGVDWYIAHQISKVHMGHICDRLGIDPARMPLTFPMYGNVGPAAVPLTLDKVQDRIQPGERVLLMGIGSGINTSVTEIVW
jgi:acyl-CoA:acyl-CoA alkyltransferase